MTVTMTLTRICSEQVAKLYETLSYVTTCDITKESEELEYNRYKIAITETYPIPSPETKGLLQLLVWETHTFKDVFSLFSLCDKYEETKIGSNSIEDICINNSIIKEVIWNNNFSKKLEFDKCYIGKLSSSCDTTNLKNCILSFPLFDKCNSNMSFTNCDMKYSRFYECKSNMSFTNCNMVGTNFNDCNLSNSSMEKSEYNNTDNTTNTICFTDCNMKNMNISGRIASNIYVRNCDFTGMQCNRAVVHSIEGDSEFRTYFYGHGGIIKNRSYLECICDELYTNTLGIDL